MDHAPEHVAHERAKELIDRFTKLEPLIDPNNDYFDSPSGKQYNPKDIFSWSRLAKDEGYDKLEALQNFEAMLANLSRAAEQKEQTKLSEKEYDVLAETEHATLYQPKSMAASCKLGRGTKWCTAATEGPNQFDSYQAQGIVLFYAITKRKEFNTAQAIWPPQPASGPGRPTGSDYKPEEKYAVAMYPGGETFEFFDAEDNKMEKYEWEDLFQGLGLPTDLSFYKKHGPSAVSILKKSVTDARNKMSGATQRDPYGDSDTNWELLMDVYKNVQHVYREGDPEQLAELAKYRRDEGMPDEVFLMDVMDRSSMDYFTDREYNPAGSNNWANAQFQEEIVRNIGRLTHLTNQANSDDWKQEDVEDMDDLTRVIQISGDGDEQRLVFTGLRQYISRHLSDEWPKLEKVLIKHWEANHDAVDIKVAGGYSEHTDHPFNSTYMWMRMMMDIKNGDWPELEKMIHKRVKSVLHVGDKDPDYENKKNGVQSMASGFNNAANFYRQMANTERRAWLPQSDEHFKRYMDGEWDIDGPPLTDQAARERQYKKFGKNENI